MTWSALLSDSRFLLLRRGVVNHDRTVYTCAFDGFEFKLHSAGSVMQTLVSYCDDRNQLPDSAADPLNWLDVFRDDRFTEARRVTGKEPKGWNAGRTGFMVWFDGIQFKAHSVRAVHASLMDYCPYPGPDPRLTADPDPDLDADAQLRGFCDAEGVVLHPGFAPQPVRDSILMGTAYDTANRMDDAIRQIASAGKRALGDIGKTGGGQ